MINPYVGLEDRAFWRAAVASRSSFDLDEVWRPKFDLRSSDRFVTFGSCFAQHIGRALVAMNFAWFNAEPAPRGLSAESARRFNYGVFSARTGNIYTAFILGQWTAWASRTRELPEEVWEVEGRFYDPFRPTVEPNGFVSATEMQASRSVAVAAFRRCIQEADYFVFTLGLTESWRNTETGSEYPLCPGTAAGVFDETRHAFSNQGVDQVLADLEGAIEQMKILNPALRFILTVSPVPLTATQSGNHVLVATMESKSILRSVAGHLSRRRTDIDYFPSYELITSPSSRGAFYAPNLRDIDKAGVDFVMNSFFKSITGAGQDVGLRPDAEIPPSYDGQIKDVICEEELLQAFGAGS